MHKQVASMLAAGGSPGQLAKYARMLAERGLNIRSVGGAEWNHHGAVGTLIDNDLADDELDALVKELDAEGFPSIVIHAAEAVLPDTPGALADACERIGDLNIATILVVDTHGGNGLVTFGFATADEAAAALDRLGDFGVAPHTLTASWAAHEQWDRENPNQPPPDPRNP
jgi:hypothetical protein